MKLTVYTPEEYLAEHPVTWPKEGEVCKLGTHRIIVIGAQGSGKTRFIQELVKGCPKDRVRWVGQLMINVMPYVVIRDGITIGEAVKRSVFDHLLNYPITAIMELWTPLYIVCIQNVSADELERITSEVQSEAHVIDCGKVAYRTVNEEPCV